ncbi:hypothetical protein NDU88_000447 [Pleurodeles waltl]|uniref:Uncharacterized protein n=1 Tax=Pleurodeles waltl TaxID=8319 RepID=A0AAV7TFL5_PLEWA|nr:hypothetical protein NDU88_000447 [Pleurodeles waltl]
MSLASRAKLTTRFLSHFTGFTSSRGAAGHDECQAFFQGSGEEAFLSFPSDLRGRETRFTVSSKSSTSARSSGTSRAGSGCVVRVPEPHVF